MKTRFISVIFPFFLFVIAFDAKAQESMVLKVLQKAPEKIATKSSFLQTKASINFANMERQVLHNVKVPLVETSPQYWPTFSSFTNRYQQTLIKFSELKKDLDVLLYYQAKSSERHELMPEERRQWLARIQEIEPLVTSLQTRMGKPDKELSFAMNYLEYARSIINPFALAPTSASQQLIPDRDFNMDEFFLHNPPESFLSFFRWKSLRPQGLAKTLPENLSVAVLNDRVTVLQKMENLHNKGVFLPNRQLHFYEKTEDLITAISLGYISPDVILTDLILPQQGGAYITRHLRKDNFKGAIIALSAFQEDEKLGRQLFSLGFDAMIPAPIGFENNFDWPYVITKSLVNYFHYKKINNWVH